MYALLKFFLERFIDHPVTLHQRLCMYHVLLTYQLEDSRSFFYRTLTLPANASEMMVILSKEKRRYSRRKPPARYYAFLPKMCFFTCAAFHGSVMRMHVRLVHNV